MSQDFKNKNVKSSKFKVLMKNQKVHHLRMNFGITEEYKTEISIIFYEESFKYFYLSF